MNDKLPKQKKANEAGEPIGKARLFCECYVADSALNGCLAAKQAGYATANASQQAYRLLNDPKCKAYIARLMEERSERVKIDSDWLLVQLGEIDGMELMDIFEPDFTMKPLDQWPMTWRKYIGSFELAELLEGQGDQAKLIRTLKKIKGPDKQRNLELIGRHVDVGAWRDQIVVDDASSLAEKLANARARVNARKT